MQTFNTISSVAFWVVLTLGITFGVSYLRSH